MSTEDWMKANGITAKDLINIYTAPADPPPSSDNNGNDGNNTPSTDPSTPAPSLGDTPISVQTHDDGDGGKDEKSKSIVYSKGGRQNLRDDELSPLTLEQLAQKKIDAKRNNDKKLLQRIQREEKVRGVLSPVGL